MMRMPQNQKAGSRPAVSIKLRRWVPGRSEALPGLKSLLGLLGLLCLLRLFSLLRFLSHSILIWVNGWKRDTRHARRRANLATSSKPIPTDSQAAAPHCHATVIALSTAVMRFCTISNKTWEIGARRSLHASRNVARSEAQPAGLTRRQRSLRVCPGPEQASARRFDLHRFKTTPRIAARG